MELTLRDYQQRSAYLTKQAMRAGKTALIICTPTGGGKTEIAISLIQSAVNKGSKVAFLVDRNVLVEQTSARLKKYGLEHGIYQADNTRDTHLPIVVSSQQTLESRDIPLTDFDLLIIDECHDQRKYITEYIKEHEPYVIGLSATPYGRGLGNIYQQCISTKSTFDLVEEGYLTPVRVMSCHPIDTKNLKLNNRGEWVDRETSERIIAVVGNIVADWVGQTNKNFGGPVKTLLYSATVDDGASLAKEFKQQGYRFEQVSYRMTQKHNQAMIDEFGDPDSDLIGLINSEMLVKGSDLPCARILVDARPYKRAFKLVAQKLGRVMRLFDDKDFALVLDHSGNFNRFRQELLAFWDDGPPENIPQEVVNDYSHPEPSERVKKETICACGYIFMLREEVCPQCGKDRPKKQPERVAHVAGRMSEVKVSKEDKLPYQQHLYLSDPAVVWPQLCAIAMKMKSNKPQGIREEEARKLAFANFFGIYGGFRPGMPKINFDPSQTYYTDEVYNYVVYRRIRYAHRRKS